MVYSAYVISVAEALAAQKEVSHTNPLQAEAGILRNVWLCEGKDVTSDSEAQQPAPPQPS